MDKHELAVFLKLKKFNRKDVKINDILTNSYYEYIDKKRKIDQRHFINEIEVFEVLNNGIICCGEVLDSFASSDHGEVSVCCGSHKDFMYLPFDILEKDFRFLDKEYKKKYTK